MLAALKPIIVAIKYSLDAFLPLLHDEKRMQDFLLARGWVSEITSVDTFRDALDIESAMQNTIQLISELINSEDKTEMLIDNVVPAIRSLFNLAANLSSKDSAIYTEFP